MTSSSARAAASRRNGARSRGPVTAAGKARSARNATKHGLRARNVVLDDEERGRVHAPSPTRCARSWRPPARSRRSSPRASPPPPGGRAAPTGSRPRCSTSHLDETRHRAGEPQAALGLGADPRRQRPARARDAGALPRLGADRAVPRPGRPQGAAGRGGRAGRRGPPGGRPGRADRPLPRPNEPEKAALEQPVSLFDGCQNRSLAPGDPVRPGRHQSCLQACAGRTCLRTAMPRARGAVRPPPGAAPCRAG